MSVTIDSQPPWAGRGAMPVAAHGMSAPVVGFRDATAPWVTPLMTSFSPPTMSRLVFGPSALSEMRLSELAVNAVTTLPFVAFSLAMRVRAVFLIVVKSPPT